MPPIRRPAICAAVLLSAALAAAQPGQGRRDLRDRANPRGALIKEMLASRANPDTNGDCLIDDEEADAAVRKTLDGLAKELAERTALFDNDGDGRLDAEEIKRLQNAMVDKTRARPPLLDRVDANGDWQLSEEEVTAAGDRLRELYRHRNQSVLEQFDKNHDGKLDAKEQVPAQEWVPAAFDLHLGAWPPAHRGASE